MGSMKNRVVDLFDQGRPVHLDQGMDELRRGLHLYIKGALEKFDSKVDAILAAMQQQAGGSLNDQGEQRRLLRLEGGGEFSGGSPGGGAMRYSGAGAAHGNTGGLDDVRRRASAQCPALFAEYEGLLALFTLSAVTSDRVNEQRVAERVRELVPDTDSHLGSMSNTSKRPGSRRGGGIPFKTATDSEIVMNAFFHLCDSGSGGEHFSAMHFATDAKSAKENLQSGSSCKAGIFQRQSSRGGPAATTYAVFYQDQADFSFVEERVPDGGKNCLYAIYALLHHFYTRPSYAGQMLPQPLNKLMRDVMRNSN
jgi:hypothetical protein